MPTRLTGSPAEQLDGSLLDRARGHGVALLWWLKAHRYRDLSDNDSVTGMLLGSARSGTTWVSELIDRHHDHRVLFEPFRPELVPQMSSFSGVRYLRRDDPAPAQTSQVARLLAGGFRNSWVDHTTVAWLPRRRLLKDVRANLLMPWLVERFPEHPVVMVVRHPVAVAASRRALGWADSLKDYLGDPALVADHVTDEQRELVGELRDPVLRAVAQWAIETAVPLRQLAADEICLVHYEELRAQPLPAMSRVLRWLGQEPDALLEQLIDRPSRTTGPEGRAQQTGGRSSLDRSQLAGVTEILSAFGLAGLYDPADLRTWDGSVTLALMAPPR